MHCKAKADRLSTTEVPPPCSSVPVVCNKGCLLGVSLASLMVVQDSFNFAKTSGSGLLDATVCGELFCGVAVADSRVLRPGDS